MDDAVLLDTTAPPPFSGPCSCTAPGARSTHLNCSLPKRQPPRSHPERPRQPLNRVRRRDVTALLDIVHRRVRESGPASQRQHAKTRGLPRLKETLSDSEAGERFFSHSVAVAWSG